VIQVNLSSLPGFLSVKTRYEFIAYDYVLEESGGDSRKGRLTYKKQLGVDLLEGLPIREKVVGQSLLGGDEFVTWIQEKYIHKGTDRERPAIGIVHRYTSKDRILQVLSEQKFQQ